MVLEKITQVFQSLKKSIIETFKLLWQFKWYILGYLFWCSSFIYEYLYPPSENDPILKYEYAKGAWNYINQEVYIQSMKLYTIEETLIFLLATSNMRNHPNLAKIIFLYPWIIVLCGAVVLLYQVTFGA